MFRIFIIIYLFLILFSLLEISHYIINISCLCHTVYHQPKATSLVNKQCTIKIVYEVSDSQEKYHHRANDTLILRNQFNNHHLLHLNIIPVFSHQRKFAAIFWATTLVLDRAGTINRNIG